MAGLQLAGSAPSLALGSWPEWVVEECVCVCVHACVAEGVNLCCKLSVYPCQVVGKAACVSV